MSELWFPYMPVRRCFSLLYLPVLLFLEFLHSYIIPLLLTTSAKRVLHKCLAKCVMRFCNYGQRVNVLPLEMVLVFIGALLSRYSVQQLYCSLKYNQLRHLRLNCIVTTFLSVISFLFLHFSLYLLLLSISKPGTK